MIARILLIAESRTAIQIYLLNAIRSGLILKKLRHLLAVFVFGSDIEGLAAIDLLHGFQGLLSEVEARYADALLLFVCLLFLHNWHQVGIVEAIGFVGLRGQKVLGFIALTWAGCSYLTVSFVKVSWFLEV